MANQESQDTEDLLHVEALENFTLKEGKTIEKGQHYFAQGADAIAELQGDHQGKWKPWVPPASEEQS